MKKENKTPKTSSQVMDLKDLISGPLVATVDADSISARRYLNYLLELAFESYDKETGEAGKLRTLDFTYHSRDVNGVRIQRVSIPLLTLVPLPLLQVKEADFGFDIKIVDAISSDRDATFSLKNGGPEEEEHPEGVKLRVAMATNAEGQSKSTARQSVSANMKVKVKMEQADMPGGLLNLLHLTTHNLQTDEIPQSIGETEEKGGTHEQ